MIGFVAKRLGWTVVLLLAITFVTFLIFFIVPSQQLSIRASRGLIAPSLPSQYRIEHQSLPQQYGHFLSRVVLHGDLGRSFRSGVPVAESLGQAVPVTASLVIGGALLWMLMAFPIGVASAVRSRTLMDRVLMIFVLIGLSAHPIWTGYMFSYVLGYKLHVFPVAGYCDFFKPTATCGGPVQWTYHLLLPWMTFAFLFAAPYARMVRASVLETMDEDYVRTARAKGASRIRVMRSHILRNALLPVVSMLGMDFGLAFGGAIFIETVYGLPGMGQMLVRAVTEHDLPIILGVVLVVCLAVAVANLIVDVIYGCIDPRARVPLRGFRRRPRVRATAVPAAAVKESPT